MRTITLIFATIIAVSIPRLTVAQLGYNTPGLKIGEKSRLHTSFQTSAAYDSNPRRVPNISSSDEATDSDASVDDWRLILKPSFLVDIPGRVNSYNFGAGVTVGQYFGVNDQPETRFGFDGQVQVHLGKVKSPVSFHVELNPILSPAVLDSLGTITTDERQFSSFQIRGEYMLF